MDLMSLKVLSEIGTIKLSEMSAIKLMNRIDTKYLIPESLLPELLEKIKNDYLVQVVAGLPVSRYQTLYYDTADIEMYTKHHDNKLRRQKIRTRTYIDSSISFLEIKNKSNKGRTSKKRIPINLDDFADYHKNPEAVEFVRLNSVWGDVTLLPQVKNRFDRITLVNKGKTERLTIDGNLSFYNFQTGQEKDIPGLMIVELKQDGLAPSLFKDLLAAYKVPAKGFSKYCLGTVSTNPDAKSNRFKTKLRYINKLTNQERV